MILRGDLRPGEPIRESLIASDLGVSRNTVREAVRILERTDLITYEMNRGARVRSPSRDEVEDLYKARLAIECGAVLVGSIEEVQAPLRQAFRKLEAALEQGNSDQALRADLDFHTTIVAMGRCDRLDAAYRRCLDEFQLCLAILSKTVGEYEKPEQIRGEHLDVLNAFEEGDVRTVIKSLRVHTELSQTACLAALDLSANSDSAGAATFDSNLAG